MRIRPASAADARAIDQLVQRAYGHYVARIGGPPGPMQEDYAAKVAEGGTSVAEDGGEVVGAIVLTKEPDALVIENVAVDPGRQGEGIGRALLAFAETVARDAGLSTLRLYTHVTMTENRAFYPRLGYEETHRRPVGDAELVFFAKQLPGGDAP
jgi:ribosomal protein S18 acetylase RimI-like enzyme